MRMMVYHQTMFLVTGDVPERGVAMIIVSACLVGIRCRYDGKTNTMGLACRLVEKGLAIPVCSEQLGGLPTPRSACEIMDLKSGIGCRRRVVTADGVDRTEHFKRGALEVLRLARLCGSRCALLKDRSPSCGVNWIHDGSFKGKVIRGRGVTAEHLSEEGIILFSERQEAELLQYMRCNGIEVPN